MTAREIASKLWKTLSDDEKLWVKTVYKKTKEGEDPRVEELKAALDDQIDRNFRPSEIRQALVTERGRHLTPYGMLAVNPDVPVIDDLNEVIEWIRSKLVDDPSLGRITAADIAEGTNRSLEASSLLLHFIGGLDQFIGSPSSDTDLPGPQSARPLFDAFYAFDGDVEQYLRETYVPEEQGDRAPEPSPRKSPFVIRPIFQSRIAHVIESFCFVLMPFSTDWSAQIYADLFKPAIEAAGYACMRADESGGQIIAEDIWQRISQAELIVADLTDKNPNVMYEIGIAHTIGKPIVLLSQDEIDPPFDVGHHRVHVYENTVSEPEQMKEWLPDVIEDVIDEHERRESQHELPLSPAPRSYQAVMPRRQGPLLGSGGR